VNVDSKPDPNPPGVVTVVEDQESAMKIAIDENRLYWYESSSGAGVTKPTVFTRVRSCLKSDCRSTITTYRSVPFDGNRPDYSPVGSYPLVAGGGNVAWVEYDAHSRSSILTCPSAGCVGGPRVLASPIEVTSLAVDESHVYWTSRLDTAVIRLPLSGTGAPQAIALNQIFPHQIALSGPHVYWIDAWGHPDASIKRVAKQGGEAELTLAKGQNQALALSVDSEFVYWANSLSAGSILRCPLSGCTGEPSVMVTRQNWPRSIAVDGKSLFWSTVNGAFVMGSLGASIMRCPIDGCESATETLAEQVFNSWGISMVVDETNLYWVAQGNPEPASDVYPHASIYRYMK
jgi:hypothetical protein